MHHPPTIWSTCMIHIYSHRYIWGHRLALARRCHDMAKQMYDNKRYSPIAWRPLQQWLNHKDPTEKLQRLTKIKSFTRHDNDLIAVFAQGLWTLANLPNLPWGRGLTTQTYSQIPKSEKVVGSLRLSLCFFFSSSISCAHICVPPDCAHMPVTQAWAVACAIRRFLGMNPTMNILSFKKDVSYPNPDFDPDNMTMWFTLMIHIHDPHIYVPHIWPTYMI